MKKFRSHYDNLKVTQDAPTELIEAAYNSLIEKYNSDKSIDDPKTKEIVSIIEKAYEVLSDPGKRKEHDDWIAEKEVELAFGPKKNRSSFSKPKASFKSKHSKEDSLDYKTVFFHVYLRKYNVTESELNNAISSGKLRSFKLGGNVFVEDGPIESPWMAPFTQTNSNSNKRLLPLFFGILFIVIIFAFNQKSPNKSQSFEPFTSVNASPAKSLPPSGVMSVFTSEPLVAPFSITSAGTYNNFIKLKNASNGNDVMTIFIRAGETTKVQVPLGNYKLMYARGRAWYGSDALFGSRTEISRAEKPFSFYRSGNQIQGHTLTLQTYGSGNLQTSRSNRNEFR